MANRTEPHRAVLPWPAVAFGLAFPSVVTLAYFVVLAGQPAPIPQTAYGLGKTIQFAVPILWIVAATRRWPRPSGRRGRGVVGGGVFGLLVFGLVLVLYHGVFKPQGILAGAPADAIRSKVQGFGVAGVWHYAALGVFYAVCHSFLEEYYWRWFVFGQLRCRSSPAWAVSVSSLGFMAHHVIVLAIFFGWGSPWTCLFSAAVALGGAAWAWLYERSGSLLGPWLSHLLVDAAIFLVGYDLVRDLFGR